jgi:hypothetical protein
MTKTRPQLSSQIDRLDGILDTFEDAIPETVRDAVKEAVKEVMAAAIKAAVVEVLRNPTIREATAPISAPVAPPAPKPTLLQRATGLVSRAWSWLQTKATSALGAARAAVTASVTATEARASATVAQAQGVMVVGIVWGAMMWETVLLGIKRLWLPATLVVVVVTTVLVGLFGQGNWAMAVVGAGSGIGSVLVQMLAQKGK